MSTPDTSTTPDIAGTSAPPPMRPTVMLYAPRLFSGFLHQAHRERSASSSTSNLIPPSVRSGASEAPGTSSPVVLSGTSTRTPNHFDRLRQRDSNNWQRNRGFYQRHYSERLNNQSQAASHQSQVNLSSDRIETRSGASNQSSGRQAGSSSGSSNSSDATAAASGSELAGSGSPEAPVPPAPQGEDNLDPNDGMDVIISFLRSLGQHLQNSLGDAHTGGTVMIRELDNSGHLLMSIASDNHTQGLTQQEIDENSIRYVYRDEDAIKNRPVTRAAVRNGDADPVEVLLQVPLEKRPAKPSVESVEPKKRVTRASLRKATSASEQEVVESRGTKRKASSMDPPSQTSSAEQPEKCTKRRMTDSDSCSICLDTYVTNTLVRRLSCLHTFHNKCIEKWLQLSKRCPICRTLVVINYKGLLSALESGTTIEQFLLENERGGEAFLGTIPYEEIIGAAFDSINFPPPPPRASSSSSAAPSTSSTSTSTSTPSTSTSTSGSGSNLTTGPSVQRNTSPSASTSSSLNSSSNPTTSTRDPRQHAPTCSCHSSHVTRSQSSTSAAATPTTSTSSGASTSTTSSSSNPPDWHLTRISVGVPPRRTRTMVEETTETITVTIRPVVALDNHESAQTPIAPLDPAQPEPLLESTSTSRPSRHRVVFPIRVHRSTTSTTSQGGVQVRTSSSSTTPTTTTQPGPPTTRSHNNNNNNSNSNNSQPRGARSNQ